MKSVYALDPRMGDALELTVRLDFDASDIAAIYNYEMDVPTGARKLSATSLVPCCGRIRRLNAIG